MCVVVLGSRLPHYPQLVTAQGASTEACNRSIFRCNQRCPRRGKNICSLMPVCRGRSRHPRVTPTVYKLHFAGYWKHEPIDVCLRTILIGLQLSCRCSNSIDSCLDLSSGLCQHGLSNTEIRGQLGLILPERLALSLIAAQKSLMLRCHDC